jgi:hypothetical protein
VLDAKRRHRTPRRIGRPLNDGKTDTGIDRFNAAHPSNIEAEVSGPNNPEASEIYRSRTVRDVLIHHRRTRGGASASVFDAVVVHSHRNAGFVADAADLRGEHLEDVQDLLQLRLGRYRALGSVEVAVAAAYRGDLLVDFFEGDALAEIVEVGDTTSVSAVTWRGNLLPTLAVTYERDERHCVSCGSLLDKRYQHRAPFGVAPSAAGQITAKRGAF